MDGRQIQDLRAMLAEQANAADGRRPKPRGGLSRLMARAKPDEPLMIPMRTPVAPATDRFAAEDDLVPPPADPAPSSPDDVIAQALLMGPLAPRRTAFGQRRESVLNLQDAAPEAPRRLTLLAASGEAVGEIILHDPVRAAPALAAAPRRRPLEPLNSPVPFFPDDLQDEPRRTAGRRVAVAKPMLARPSGPAPDPDMAATFLLATLAARLAGEQAALTRRMATLA